ncbi:MAG: 2-oxoacid:acceptor oxidoreductase subunit alpha, partial [Anaerolineae bacterium]|nr:2-oxoacid:acceptor oxidoreductase subunit alpha [Anaerolineae bacterium]
KGGREIMRNTVALGVVAGLLDFEPEYIAGVIRDNFTSKGQETVDANLRAAEAGVDVGHSLAARFPFRAPVVPNAPHRLILNGNEAFALGALAGGCRFVSGYPMTPGSPVLQWFSGHAADYGVVTKHAEDEIAAINMAIGAAHAGARTLVPTSGGGFSLMVEGLGLAGITETPVVIYNAQRPGPATGLPTRHEQADLLFSIFASQGEFPRFVLTPGSIEEAFRIGWQAFNLAERHQTPAVVLGDHFLATTYRTVDMQALDFDTVSIDRGSLLSVDDLDTMEEPYLRYRITESGVSPRAIPGHPHAVYVAASNEHDERGAISESIANRVAQVDKRARKLIGMARDTPQPTGYGPRDGTTALICWGSTYGAVRETVDVLNRNEPGSARMVHFSSLCPFPTEATEQTLISAQQTVVVEMNSTGQLEKLLRMHTGFTPDGHIRKYDGRAFTPGNILAGLKEVA